MAQPWEDSNPPPRTWTSIQAAFWLMTTMWRWKSSEHKQNEIFNYFQTTKARFLYLNFSNHFPQLYSSNALDMGLHQIESTVLKTFWSLYSSEKQILFHWNPDSFAKRSRKTHQLGFRIWKALTTFIMVHLLEDLQRLQVLTEETKFSSSLHNYFWKMLEGKSFISGWKCRREVAWIMKWNLCFFYGFFFLWLDLI